MASRRALTIAQINDVHAYLELHQELFRDGGGDLYRPAGGYARIATLLEAMRREARGGFLLADCGDTLHGTYPAVTTRGQALIPILNRLGIDAMTAHWDFAYGPKTLRQRVSELGYPLLAANVYHEDTGQLAYPSHLVKEVAGLRVGLVGLASNIVDKTMPPSFGKGLRFTDGRRELPTVVEQLRQGEKVDLVILISHLGFPQDMQLLSEVSGVGVCLSGHTHNRLRRPALQGRTIVIQSGSHGSFVGRLDVEVESGRVVDYRHRLIEVSEGIDPDPEVAELVREAMAPFAEQLSQVVGETVSPLHRMATLESPMDNFLLLALQEATGAELAFSNGWRYGAPIVPGEVTLNDLYNITPGNPPVSTVELTGEELWEMLEDNLEKTFSRDPFEQMGGYVKRCLGLRVYFKVENPAGHRIERLFVRGSEVELYRSYHAAFVTVQGVPARFGRNRREHPERAVEAMLAYLKRHSPLQVDTLGTLVLA